MFKSFKKILEILDFSGKKTSEKYNFRVGMVIQRRVEHIVPLDRYPVFLKKL